jgi:hypothetical protein
MASAKRCRNRTVDLSALAKAVIPRNSGEQEAESNAVSNVTLNTSNTLNTSKKFHDDVCMTLEAAYPIYVRRQTMSDRLTAEVTKLMQELAGEGASSMRNDPRYIEDCEHYLKSRHIA